MRPPRVAKGEIGALCPRPDGRLTPHAEVPVKARESVFDGRPAPYRWFVEHGCDLLAQGEMVPLEPVLPPTKHVYAAPPGTFDEPHSQFQRTTATAVVR